MRRKAPVPRRLAKLSRNMQLSFVKAHGLRRESDEGEGMGKKKKKDSEPCCPAAPEANNGAINHKPYKKKKTDIEIKKRPKVILHNTLFDHNHRAKSKYAKKKKEQGKKERKQNRKEVEKKRKTDSKEMCKTFLFFFF